MSNDSRKFKCAVHPVDSVEAREHPNGVALRSLVDAEPYYVVISDTEAVEFAEAVLAAAGVYAVVVTDLPDVDRVTDGEVMLADGTGYTRMTPETHRIIAGRHLAIARHLEQNPPVDPQVQALTDDLNAWCNDRTAQQAAAELVAKGWRRD